MTALPFDSKHVPLDFKQPLSTATFEDVAEFFSRLREEAGTYTERQKHAVLGDSITKTATYVASFNQMSMFKYMENQFGANWHENSWCYSEGDTGDVDFYEEDDVQYYYVDDGFVTLQYKGRPLVLHTVFSYQMSSRVVHFFYAEHDKEHMQPLMKEFGDYCENLEYFKGKTVYYKYGTLLVKDKPSIKLDEVVMDDDMKSEIEKNTLSYFNNKEQFNEKGIEVRRGVMLSGPPGNGKTITCKAVNASVPSDVTTIWVTAGSMNDVGNVSTLFVAASKLSPSLIIVEDFDSLVVNRQHSQDNGLLGEFLTRMDGLDGQDGIVTLVTTNYPERIDDALKNRPKRFDRHYKIPLPNMELRGRLFDLESSRVSSIEVSEQVKQEIIRKSDGFSAVFYSELFHTASVNAALRNAPCVEDEDIKSALKEVMVVEAPSAAKSMEYL